MPNWKKIITSGSDAVLKSVTSNAGFTGSLLGTATIAVSASGPVNMVGFSGAATYPLCFVENTGSGYRRLYNYSAADALTFNFGTRLMDITSSWASRSISSSRAESAGTASLISVTNTTSGTGPYYLLFTDNVVVPRTARADTSALSFNATTETLTVTNLAGTASWASNVLTADSASAAFVSNAGGGNYAITVNDPSTFSLHKTLRNVVSPSKLVYSSSIELLTATSSWAINALTASYANLSGDINVAGNLTVTNAIEGIQGQVTALAMRNYLFSGF